MPSVSKKKVALVLTGALSLGSFEAGVAYEIARYIQEQENPGIEIDVIVGTSAGALTGALTAMVLANGADPRILEESWLSVKLEDLLRLNPRDKSILSSSKVENIISRYIGPVSASQIRYRDTQPVSLAVVVTNLDGIKYSIQRTRDKAFSISAIGYEDSVRFNITRDFSDWERLRNAVTASSAFPVAFEHKKLLRNQGEFRKNQAHNFAGRTARDFNCSDGGIVNNQPLNTAIEIVNDLPYYGPEEGYERVFLVVDPTPPENDLQTGKEYSVFDVAGKALWTIPRNQTLFKDLLLLEKVNRRIQWKNTFISAVADIWNRQKLTEPENKALDELCYQIAQFKGKSILGIEPEKYLEVEKRRLSGAYKTQLNRVSDADSFMKYCFLLEQIADLRNKQEVSVEMICPLDAEKELAGVIFGSFGGFLDSNFMKHDFNVGRTYAKRWLKTEIELYRKMYFRQQELSPKIQKQVLQKLLDNSVSLLVEDFAPKVFASRNLQLNNGLKVFTLTTMISKSFFKYVLKKSWNWTKSLISFGK